MQFVSTLQCVVVFGFTDCFVSLATQLTQEKTDKFFELLSQLPKVNYDTLQQLMRHLNR
jgi:hypothetical protein